MELPLTKGQLVYWVRRSTEEVESVRVYTINEQSNYFTCLALQGQRTYLFSFKCLDETIFTDPAEAEQSLEVLQQKWSEERHQPEKGSLSYVLRGVKEESED